MAHLQEQVRWLEESKLALEQRNRVLLESVDHQVYIDLAQDYALQGRKVQELKVAIGQLVEVCTPLSPLFVRCPSNLSDPLCATERRNVARPGTRSVNSRDRHLECK